MRERKVLLPLKHVPLTFKWTYFEALAVRRVNKISFIV